MAALWPECFEAREREDKLRAELADLYQYEAATLAQPAEVFDSLPLPGNFVPLYETATQTNKQFVPGLEISSPSKEGQGGDVQ